MNLPRKTTFSRVFNLEIFSLILFTVVHIALFNVNTAEWGDSYRILRASEFIRQGSYPLDEKRPPLFSIFTAIRPSSIDAVVWGRVVMLIFSLLAFLTFRELVKIYIKDNKYRFLALLFFIFNPIYLYWSLRIMADVPFSFFVLLAFYLLRKYSDKGPFKYIIVGFISGLSILTRFEGYLLFASLVVGSFFTQEDLKDLIQKKSSFLSGLLKLFLRNWKNLIILGLTTFVTILPWIIFRNPFKSSYFEEPYGRAYDFKMVWTYFVSIIYSFGFTSAFYFIFSKFKVAFQFLKENLDITTFTVLELLLILLWPAAIPRLFVCLMPFFIIILTLCMQSLCENKTMSKKRGIDTILIPSLFLLSYIGSQYFLKLQFLITNKKVFVVLLILQILIIIFYYFKKTLPFFSTLTVSIIIWALAVIISHREIYKAIKLVPQLIVT